MKKNWFENIFLPSVTERMINNIKYPYTMILSDKQADICEKNMKEKQCSSDYGWFSILEYEANGYRYQMTYKGKYRFLRCREISK